MTDFKTGDLIEISVPEFGHDEEAARIWQLAQVTGMADGQVQYRHQNQRTGQINPDDVGIRAFNHNGASS